MDPLWRILLSPQLCRCIFLLSFLSVFLSNDYDKTVIIKFTEQIRHWITTRPPQQLRSNLLYTRGNLNGSRETQAKILLGTITDSTRTTKCVCFEEMMIVFGSSNWSCTQTVSGQSILRVRIISLIFIFIYLFIFFSLHPPHRPTPSPAENIKTF